MISGEQCVMTCGTALMLLWSASSWDTLTLEVSLWDKWIEKSIPPLYFLCL